ncbi:MAG: T9SS type A sorting domain-containing protein [Bacteroidia bacterium]|nr:T9SS type A sorting domain-containing protein [Bacteroidia bacterium]
MEGQKVVSIVGKASSVYQQKIHGSYLYMMLGYENAYRIDLYRLKIPNGNPEPLDTNIRWGQSVLMTDSGVFYVSLEYDANGNDGKHYLNYFSFSKNAKVFSKVINLYVQHPNRTRPSSPSVTNQKYYICAYFNGKNCIWESDGTEVGTKTIISSNLDLNNYRIFLGKPIVISSSGNNQVLLNHKSQEIYKYAATAQNKMGFFHCNNDVCILVRNSKLIRLTDQYQIDSTSFANNGYIPFYSISYFNDSAITGYKYVNNQYYNFSLKLTPPFTYDSVPPSKFVQSMGKYVLDVTNRQFMSIWSMKHGVEMAFAPRFDSLRFVTDLYPGPNSGIFNIKLPGDMIEAENIAYFFGRNGSDKKYYLYSCDGKSMKSHFPVDVSRNFTKLVCKNDSFIYWSYFIKDTLFIENRNLFQIDSQPPFKYFKNDNHAKNGEWLRTVAMVSSYSKLVDYNKTVYSNAVKSDKNGNVFSSGSLSEPGNGNYYQCYSDTNLFQKIKGDKFIVKYDSLGNLLWNFSFGNYKAFNQQNFAFDIDHQGDVVVSSKYSTELFLDTLVLKNTQSVSYAFKLDGQTGRIKWLNQFMINGSFNSNPDQKLTIDNENNIYVSFNFYGGIANVGSFQINSTMSPANAILKLDKDGKSLWAKCTETPWTDKYGLSRSLTFDSVNQCVYNLIGQGAYNWWSSCKYSNFRSIVHKININGEFNEVQQIEGDDLNGSRVMTMTKNNSIFVSGFYRGDLSIAQLSIKSSLVKKSECNNWEQFYGTINTKNEEPGSLRGTPNYEFFPLDICSDSRYIYVLGASGIPNEKMYSLSIQRYTHLGRLAGKRLLNQCLVESPFDFNDDYNIELNGNSHFVISMNAYSRISPFDNFVDNCQGLSVYRLLKEADWIDEPIKTEKEVLSGIVVAPNPADDFIGLQFNNPIDYSKLVIYSSLGQLVQTNLLNGEIYKSISIENLSSGIYTLQFQGQQVQSMKLVVN